MKFSTLLLIAVIGAGVWFYTQRPALLSTSRASGPVVAIERLVAEFPSGYSGVAYNVEKTDSMVNPIIGYIDFDGSIGYEYVLHWRDDRWQLSKLLCRDNGKDFTGWGGGLEVMMRPDMRAFLAKVGWQPTPDQVREAQEQARKLEEYLARQQGGSTHKPNAGPTPRGNWMWEGRGNALER